MPRTQKTPEQWIDFIAQQELPALTSTAKLLDKFANDDVSSLPKLSKAILHDQALSSCLLKVANNAQRIGANKVTTVSRATVVLGIQTVKNICLTSKVIDSLIKNKNLDIEIFNEIKRLMACSFFAGQLAKMMIPDYSDEIKEEVYLASMLYRIGETAFWCLDDTVIKDLNALIALPKHECESASFDLLGMNYKDLSVGLAQRWNLGDMLVKSLDHPENRTTEMKVIYYADKLAEYIDCPPTIDEFDGLITEISALMDINARQLKHRVGIVRDRSIELLSSYGADILTENIKPYPKHIDFQSTNSTVKVEAVSKEMAILQLINKLTEKTLTNTDVNGFMESAIKGVINVFNFDTVSFYLLGGERDALLLRNSSHHPTANPKQSPLIDRLSTTGLLHKLVKQHESYLINNIAAPKYSGLINVELSHLINRGKLILCPVQIEQNTVGMICTRQSETTNISTEDFVKVKMVVQHLSMCLSLINKRR